MELLKIKHHDFVMTIECTKFDAIWDKAKRNVGEDKLSSTYSWSDGVEQVERYLNDQSTSEVILKDSSAPAIFFDNADYPIWVEFEEKNTAKVVDDILVPSCRMRTIGSASGMVCWLAF